MLFTFLAVNGFQYAFEQSSIAGISVCIALGILSAISWAVMFTKFFTLSKAARENRRFLDAFREANGPLDPFEQQVTPKGAPLFSVYAAGCRELCIHLLGSAERDELFGTRVQNAERVTPSQMEGVRTAMERAVGEMALRLEDRMNFLATAVSGAPFIGLLGTVWGVMDTFSGIAAAGGGASLAEMAPGVSAALVTTVVGLLVAIPAMFGYNYLINSIKSMVLSLDHYAAELQTRFERRYVNYGRNLDISIAKNAPEPTDIPPRIMDGEAATDDSSESEKPAAPESDPDQETASKPPLTAAVGLSRRTPIKTASASPLIKRSHPEPKLEPDPEPVRQGLDGPSPRMIAAAKKLQKLDASPETEPTNDLESESALEPAAESSASPDRETEHDSPLDEFPENDELLPPEDFLDLPSSDSGSKFPPKGGNQYRSPFKR